MLGSVFSDLKSMISGGLAAIASCNYNLMDAVTGNESMHILCIGHGGGSLPLFLASKIQGGLHFELVVNRSWKLKNCRM